MGNGGTSHQRMMAKKAEERIAQEAAKKVLQTLASPVSANVADNPTPKPVAFSRSSVEAYIFFIFGGGYAALTAFGIPVNFLAGCVLSFAVAYCAIRLLWRSPWTLGWTALSRSSGTAMVSFATLLLINQGYLLTHRRPSNALQSDQQANDRQDTASAIANLTKVVKDELSNIQKQSQLGSHIHVELKPEEVTWPEPVLPFHKDEQPTFNAVFSFGLIQRNVRRLCCEMVSAIDDRHG